jgi:multidrug resistance efflux pump
MSIENIHPPAKVGSEHSPIPFRFVDGIAVTRRDSPGGGRSYFIKSPRGDVMQFGAEEHFLWRALDGDHSFADIQAQFDKEFGNHIAREQFDDFLGELARCGLVEPVAVPEPPAPVAQVGAATSSPGLSQAEIELRPDGEPYRFAFRGVNPAATLRALAFVGGPLRYFRWLLIPGTIAGAIVCASQAPIICQELAGLGVLTSLGLLAFGVLLTGLLPPVVQACVAAFYGAASRTFGVTVRGLVPLPRLYFDDSAYDALAARGITSILAAPLMTRLMLFAGGAVYWLANQDPTSAASMFAVVISQLALLSFLISAAPLWPTQGRRWLAMFLADPDLGSSGSRNRLSLTTVTVFWATAVISVAALYAAPLLSLVGPGSTVGARMLISAMGVVLTLVAITTQLWLYVTAKNQAAVRIRYVEAGSADRPTALAEGGVVLPVNREAVPGVLPTRRPMVHFERSLMPVIAMAAGVAVLEALAFVPYAYEAGGNFTILPYDSSQLNARVAGELTQVLVNEGDFVVPGQILGTLSDWQEKFALATAKAQLENAQAALQNLYENPEPEVVELARQQYLAAMSKLPYDEAQFERYAALVKNDTVSRTNYDQVVSQYQQDQAAADVARANYDQVRIGATPAQIEAARALVRQNVANVAFNEDQLQRTRIRATSAGRMVTPNPMLLRGMYFAQGALIFTVEDHRMVQADVQVPETDIANVQPGGNVRLRPWGYPETTFLGKSIAVAPDAQVPPANSGLVSGEYIPSSSTNLVRVRTLVPNPDGALHPQMDGYAKLTGLNMPVWKAFGGMVERFVLVGIWSWIP